MGQRAQARAEVSTRRLLDAARDLIAEVGYLLYVLVERMTVTWAQREGRTRPSQGTGREAVLARGLPVIGHSMREASTS